MTHDTNKGRVINIHSMKGSRIRYDAEGYKMTKLFKWLGWTIMVIGIIGSYGIAQTTHEVLDYPVFSFSTFFAYALGSIATGALFLGLGEIISQLRMNNELQDVEIKYLKTLVDQTGEETGNGT
ncbi:hypothetical protein IMZ31_24165 (plasmid) [Pontibacillus sp. ALD_SL1]|uniref:hypothetical protein n=1 Tax=Pontibacillus sp. ALD_SL1 TaxID=2777185 RepID=UPI001A97A497|nr:hypothetical protein [Pontibacillus sp. ALD_SL1]QST02548.1 hypothetical protein IMZ31_24165 [Pontibacillus sp. ALD_SL1]